MLVSLTWRAGGGDAAADLNGFDLQVFDASISSSRSSLPLRCSMDMTRRSLGAFKLVSLLSLSRFGDLWLMTCRCSVVLEDLSRKPL